MTSHITRRSALDIIRLLDFCYKKGVADAAGVEDDLAVQDWVDATYKQGRYGLVDFPDEECDWKRWRFFLLRWCRDNRLSKLGYDYIDSVRRVSGLEYVIIPMTMRFYLKGVMDWLEYPNELGLALFKSKARQLWGAKLKALRTDDYVLYVQEYIYEFRQFPMMEMFNFPSSALDNFEYAIWQMTRPTDGKIR